MDERAWQDRPKGGTCQYGITDVVFRGVAVRAQQPVPIHVRLTGLISRGGWDGDGTIVEYDRSSAIVCALHVHETYELH